MLEGIYRKLLSLETEVVKTMAQEQGVEEYEGLPGATADIVGNGIQFILPDPLPKRIRASDCKTEDDILELKRLEKALEERWIGWMKHAYMKINHPIRFENALCSITVYMSFQGTWDIDNRNIRFVLNGIKNLRIIEDDSWDNIDVLMRGRVDKLNPRTEVLVTPNQV